MSRFGSRFLVIFTLALAILGTYRAQAEMQFAEGRWRLEVSGGTGIESGLEPRSNDLLLQGSVEYEIPATKRVTLGLRLLPFLYDQKDDSERPLSKWLRDGDRPEDGDTVAGGGFGITTRIYSRAKEYRGVYLEIAAAVIGHKGQIDGNSSNINFLSGAGVGYQFKNDWHAIVKYEHISNAGLGEHNRGTNTVSLGVGFSF